MISVFKESTKEFCNNLASGLSNMGLSRVLTRKISEYKAWLDNWKQDQYLQIVDRIRNSLRFHISSRIYDNYIKDGGNKTKDLLIGISVGERAMDFCFIEPYTFELSYIAEIVPDSVGKDKIDWIQERSVEEASRLIKLLKEILREIFRDNAYKKLKTD